MAVIIAEGWKTYADKSEVVAGWPLHANLPASAGFAELSGRRTLDLYGGKVVRAFPPLRKVCLNFIVDLTSGALSSSWTLFSLGLNPANIASAAYTSTTSDRFRVEATGTVIRVIRQAFNPDGSMVSASQTVASVNHTMVAGASYRIEVMVDVSGETGTAEVMINGVAVITAEFSRAIGAVACDAPYGIVSLYSQSTAACRGRVSNLVLYSDAAPTRWPAGPLNISYLPAQPNAGESITFPPALTDPEITVDTPAGKTWQLGDLGGVSASAIKGVIGSVRLNAPDAVIPASVDVQFKDGATVMATETHIVQPGTPAFDRHISIPTNDPAALNRMTMTVKRTA